MNIFKKIFIALYQFAFQAGARLGLRRLPWLRQLNVWILTHIVRHFKSKRVVILGHTMQLDANDSLSLSIFGFYEPATTAVFEKEIHPGQVVLDIGANIGYFTLLAARQVGPQGHVFAFEPDEANFALLQQNLQLNGYTNVTTIRKAVSDSTGTATFYVQNQNRLGQSLLDLGEGRLPITVETVRLDDYLAAHHPGPIHFIKMDIEGAEPLALQGMHATLTNNPHLKLITEILPDSMRQHHFDPAQYLAALQHLGFKFFNLNDRETRIEPVPDPASLLAGKHNVLCVRDC